jgi:hypothetical protein
MKERGGKMDKAVNNAKLRGDDKLKTILIKGGLIVGV